MKKVQVLFLLATGLMLLANSCKISDVRKSTTLQHTVVASADDRDKGKQILDAFVRKNGYDKFAGELTYQVAAHERWKGMMGMMSNIWPSKTPEFVFKNVSNQYDFFNQVTLTAGKGKGETWGIGLDKASYHDKPGKPRRALNKDGKMAFGLANYQWWFEFPFRIQTAKQLVYAGEKTRDGQQYDLVYATWGDDLNPSPKHDQYLMWFNKTTGNLDLVTFTFRAFPMPMPKNMYGTALFADYKSVEGINMPHTHIFQIKDPGKKSKYVHQFVEDEIRFNVFDKSTLTQQ